MSTRNAADEGQVRQAKEKELLGREQEIADLQHLLGLPQGRRFLWSLLGKAGLHMQSAVQSGSFTYFNEGRRSIANMVLADILEANEDGYFQMIKENKEKK